MNAVTPAAARPVSAGLTPSTPAAAPGSDVFMEILLSQLRNQNPLEPMKDSEMISQFSQLNSLQALVGMKDMLAEIAAVGQVSYGAGLVGRQVRAARADGSVLEGVVGSVRFEGSQVYLTIGDEKLPLDNLLEVVEPPAQAEQPVTVKP